MKKYAKTIFVGIATAISLYVFGSVLVQSMFYALTEDTKESVSYVIPQKAFAEDSTKKTEGTEVIKDIKKVNPLHPSRLQIPVLKIDTKIQQVGITKKGNMATPSNFTSVGWYKYGTIPGNKGSAVIAGHVDNGLGLSAVFKRLENIKEGDDIYITNEKNKKIHFVVTDIAVYDYNAGTEEIFNEKDGSVIRLITCTGLWVKAYGTRDKRLVVTAKLI